MVIKRHEKLSKDCLRWHYVKFSNWVVVSSEKNWRLPLDVSVSMLWSSFLIVCSEKLFRETVKTNWNLKWIISLHYWKLIEWTIFSKSLLSWFWDCNVTNTREVMTFSWGRSAQTDRNIETPSQPLQFFSELPHGATASFTSSSEDTMESYRNLMTCCLICCHFRETVNTNSYLKSIIIWWLCYHKCIQTGPLSLSYQG